MTKMKMVFKVLLIPVVAVLTLLQWTEVFLNSVPNVVFRILILTVALTGIASLMFGQASGSEALKMIIIGLETSMVPIIGE